MRTYLHNQTPKELKSFPLNPFCQNVRTGIKIPSIRASVLVVLAGGVWKPGTWHPWVVGEPWGRPGSRAATSGREPRLPTAAWGAHTVLSRVCHDENTFYRLCPTPQRLLSSSTARQPSSKSAMSMTQFWIKTLFSTSVLFCNHFEQSLASYTSRGQG